MKKLIHPNSTTKVPRFIPSFFRTMLLALLCMGGGSALAQTVTIQKVTPSGCYYYSGASKTTFSVQVGWTGANNNDIITVRIDNNVATQRIINVEDMYDPGTGSAVAGPIGTPQVVAFEIDADGISHTITAVMSGAHSATATPMVANAPTPCVPMACIAGELGGTIFNDNNADGVKQAGETVGLPGITITAFDKNGATYTATSDVRGAYAFSSANGNLIPSNAYPIRLEFTNFPAYAFSNSGPSLSGNKSSVRFVSSPQCDINCGAVNPINYSQSNPVLVTNLYTNNNPLGGGNAGTTAGLIAHDYTNETNFNYTTLATTNLIGSVWAKAWNKFSKKMIIAASLKRHSGFGPLGIGGLYMVNYTNPGSPVFSNFIDLTTLGIDLGQGVIPSNVARGMGASKTSANTDAQSYAYIGKAGIGGMDFSDDGNILYFVNLFDRKVYSLDLTTYFSNGTMPTAANLNSLVIPDPGCSNGSFRPYALKIRDGKMYIGIICDGSTGTKSNLVGIVKAYDFNTTSWSDVFDFPLTYPKGYPDQADGTRTGWYVWSDNPSIVNPGNNTAVMHPVPMLSDIEFDMDGTMVIALMDRTCHQYGIANNDNWNGSSWSGSSIWLVAAGGDVLRAFYSDGAYVLENAAKAGPNVGYAPTNNQGPGFGEFYNDNIGGGQLYHSEIGTGGLALRPGSGEVIAGMVDPSFYKGDGVLWANGIRKMSNTTGQPTGGKSYYSDAGISLFGKANGMGDMELVSDNVAYLEVGNYVYFDRNEDGIQTPGEPGIPNVQVKLYNSSTGALVASTTTDANGNYYFSTLNGHNIIPNTQYMIVMGETQFALVDTSFTIGGEKYKITQTDIGQGLNPDLNDNDFSETTLSTSLGAIPANLPFVLFTTGSEGYVRHSFDLGLKSCVAYAGLDQTINCVINSVTLGTPSKPYYTYSWSPSTGLNDSTLAQPTANPILTTTYTLTVNGICTDEVTVFVSNDPPVADAGINQNLGCSVTSATIGTTALSGNSYSWSPATGLNATNIAQPTASPSSTTTYTVTVTGSNGCTATSTVLVDVNTSPPTADAGSSQNLDCTTTSATIGTSAIGGNTYSWSPATGLSSTTIAQPTANPITTTTYTVTVTGSNGCTATSTATINVIATPPTADAGSTQNLDCTTTSATIGTSAIGGNTYSWSPATGLSSTTIAQPTASPSSTTVYTVTVTGSNGCTATSTVTVNVNTTTPTADAGSTQNLDCTTTSATIGTSAIGGNTYSWSPATGLSSTTIAQPTASPTSTTVYTVTVTGSNGCTATSTVTVNVNTTTPTADAGSTQNLDCTTTSATIGTSAIGGNTYSWSPATGLSSTTIAQPTASPSSTTVYTVTVTGSNGCTATSTVTVDVNTTAPTIVISGSTVVCNGSTTTLTASGASTYVWSNTDITPSTTVGVGTYTVTGTASNGCTATSTVDVINQQGSIGNYVWEDLNKNGLNDELAMNGINGVAVELWKETAPASGIYAFYASTTTANDGGSNPGYYNFPICENANYQIHFPSTIGSLKLTNENTTPNTDNNSDANPISGLSPVIAIDVTGVGVSKDNMTIDAGYYSSACLGNYVWNDENQDGIQNNGEVGVSGVTTTLYNATTNVILATVTTDAYGFYQFCGLNPGDYKVGFSLPTNYVFTGSNTGGDDTIDSDPSNITGLTATITLASGDSNMTVDAGIYQPQPTTATVGDRVWFDANNNGTQDPGEQGVSGVTVTLYNCANPTTPIATTITGANGNYIFENVAPGSYSVSFTAPIGTTFTSQTGSVSTTNNSDADATGKTACFPVLAGDQITYVDAGIIPQTVGNASIGDKVWNDANQDGIQDPTETGVAGVTVTLYDASGTTVISTTTTDGLGNYGFNDLAPGCYVVGFGLPVGYTRTLQGAGSDTTKNSDANTTTGLTSQVCVSAGQNNSTIDAGIYNASNTNSLGDKVWYDVDKDGIQDVGEYGYPGVVVTLYDCTTNTIQAITTTDANGNYLFDGIANGSYYVGFGFIPGFQFTGANADVAGILGGNNSDANPSSGLTACVSLTGNTNITTVDAGIYPGNTRNATSSLGDIVWLDANSNGLQDNGETGVPGVTATLINATTNAVLATTITDGLGNYIFTNLDGGNYKVEFSNIPVGYTFTTQGSNIEDEDNSDANPATGKTNSIPLGVGEDKMSVDAGIVAPLGTVCLGDYVWIDLDNDGVQEANEPAVPGVTVKLYDNNTNTVLQVATTNREGNYLFCGLTTGNTYSVGFENLPAGFTFTTSSGALSTPDNSDANPVTGRTTTVTLGATNDLTLDAGIYSPTTAVVGNYVWYDEDADGIQDPTEAPIPGVLVTLYDNTNTPVASAVTDANGGYLFTNVAPGTYTIGFEGYPSTLIPTTKGANPSADDDSNIDPITGRTDAFIVTPGSSNLTLDAGYKANPIAGLGNYVWYDINENGLQDASEPGISGVIVSLFESDGSTLIATAITDGNGAYSFPNLPAGSYVVGFTAPAGYTRTKSLGGLNDALNSDVDVTNKTAVVTLIAGEYNPNIDAGYYIGIPLPTREFKATLAFIQTIGYCEVNWYTKEEQNTSHFEIERSLNAVQYAKVGEKLAAGNTLGLSNYNFSDYIATIVNVPVIYYRIKLIDMDGKSSYSNVISLRLGESNAEEVVVYPTPFTQTIHIDYQASEATEILVELTDINGKVIITKSQSFNKGLNQIAINDLESLSSANYLIRIRDLNTGLVYVRKLLK